MLRSDEVEDLTRGSRDAFRKVEEDFLARMELGEFDGDSQEQDEVVDEPKANDSSLHAVGLDRAKEHDETTKSRLEQRRNELLKKNKTSQPAAGNNDDGCEPVDPEKAALQVVTDLGLVDLPINPARIAEVEGIELLGTRMAMISTRELSTTQKFKNLQSFTSSVGQDSLLVASTSRWRMNSDTITSIPRICSVASHMIHNRIIVPRTPWSVRQMHSRQPC